MSRFDLHSILLSRVPKDKVFMNHKIESSLQDKHKVTIRCTNNTFHQADILVGAGNERPDSTEAYLKKRRWWTIIHPTFFFCFALEKQMAPTVL